MALKAVIESLESVAEPFRTEYKQDPKTQKYVLDVEKTDGFELASVEATLNAANAARRERDDARKALKRWEGLDPDSTREALEKFEELKKADPEALAKAKVDEFKASIVKEHEKAVGKVKAEVASLETALSNQMIRNAAQTALAELGAGKYVKLGLPYVLEHTKLRKSDDGTYVVDVLDDNGVVRVGDANGTPMTVKQLVESMRSMPEYTVIFEGTGNSGTGGGGPGGAPPSRSANGVRTIKSSDPGVASGKYLDDIASGKVVVEPG